MIFNMIASGGGASAPSVNTITKAQLKSSVTITFDGLTKEPTMFAVIANSEVTFSTSRKILSVVADGTRVYAVTGYKSGTNGVAYITGSNVSWSYSKGTLTVNSDSINTAGYFYSPIEYVLVYS